MRKTQLSILVLLMGLLLVACAPPAAPTPAPASAVPAPVAPIPVAPGATTKAAWEIEWEKVVEAAKNEREVVVITPRPGYRAELAPLFKGKYGLTVEFLVGRAGDVTPKILAERRAGIYSYDVYQGGANTILSILKPAGALDPLEPILILPEVSDPKGWVDNKLPWLDRDRTSFVTELIVQPMLAINTNLVKPQELKSYRDLLAPRWKGKTILADPFRQGVGGKSLGILAEHIMGWDYLRELKKNEPVVVQDMAQARDWLSFGKAAVVFGPQTSTFVEAIRAGAPITWYNAEEGGYLTGIAIINMVNRAPHRNAGKVFINWLLSREAQTAASRASGNPSSREDVPTDFINPLLLRQPGVKYINAMDEDFELSFTDMPKKLAEILATK